jgi:hypothetical protein
MQSNELQQFLEWFENTYPVDFEKYSQHITHDASNGGGISSIDNAALTPEEQETLNRYITQFYEIEQLGE